MKFYWELWKYESGKVWNFKKEKLKCFYFYSDFSQNSEFACSFFLHTLSYMSQFLGIYSSIYYFFFLRFLSLQLAFLFTYFVLGGGGLYLTIFIFFVPQNSEFTSWNVYFFFFWNSNFVILHFFFIFSGTVYDCIFCLQKVSRLCSSSHLCVMFITALYNIIT